MRLSQSFALAAALAASGAVSARAAEPAKPTHETARTIEVKGGNGTALQTLCPAPDGGVIALVAPPRYGGTPNASGAEVQVFTADGKQARRWKVGFTAQSINVGPGGTVYVAGDGKLARFDAAGKLLAEAELPHLAKVLADTAALRKQAEEQLQAQIKSFEESLDQFKKQKADLAKKDAKDLTAEEKSQLQLIEMQVRQYEQIADQYKKQTVDQVLSGITGRLRIVNGVAATEKDVFLACGEVKGYGYSVWRLDADFTNPRQIVTGLGGCCGQMDVQARGDEVYVAENTRHRVNVYTRDGKRVSSFGKHGREGDAECFGSCCNPMNLRLAADGSVYTAESEGVVKLFSPKGEFVGVVGTATLKSGCKNVAVGVSPDGNTVYFCDQPGSRIIVMARKNGAKASE